MKHIFLSAFILIAFGCDKASEKLEDINPIDQFISDPEDKSTPEVVEENAALDAELESLNDLYLKLINDYRSDLGVDVLTYSQVMAESSLAHSKNMASKVIPFGHLGSSARCSEIQRILGGGNLCGEVVAMGQKTIDAVFNSWKTSPGHNEIMINPRYTHTGLGFHRSAEGYIYWTQIFLELD